MYILGMLYAYVNDKQPYKLLLHFQTDKKFSYFYITYIIFFTFKTL